MRYTAYINDKVTYTVVFTNERTGATRRAVGFESKRAARAYALGELKHLLYGDLKWKKRIRRATRADYKVTPRLPNARQELAAAVSNVINKTKIEKL